VTIVHLFVLDRRQVGDRFEWTGVKEWGKHNAKPSVVDSQLSMAKTESYPSGARDCISRRYFGSMYGQHFSYHKGVDDARKAGVGVSDYTLAHPWKFYADLFAAYFAKTPRAGNVPAWAEGYFAQVESSYVRPMMQAKDGKETSAEGGALAKQSDGKKE
jgi:hypothetical protein